MNFRKLWSHVAAVAVLTAHTFTALAQAPAPAPPSPTVRTIEIQFAGAATISREKILANMRTQVGRPYSQQAVEEDIRTLYATGDVSNVRIFGEPQGEGVKVVVVVAGKSQVTAVELAGITRFKVSRVRKELTTKPGEPLSEAGLETDRQKILEYYQERGFTDTDVRYDVQTDERAGTTSVIFNVVEGEKTEVRRVRFEGNANIKSRALAKVVKTKPKTILSFLTKTGKLDAEQLSEDGAALQEYYQNQGYIDVVVQPARIERYNSKVDVIFPVVEGPQYHISSIDLGAPQVFTVDELTTATKLRPGAVYSPGGLRADIKAIQDLYGSRGYVDFRAEAATTPGGSHEIAIQYTLDEGVQSYTEHINISGNTRTQDKVIRREIAVAPGDVMNTVRMEASRQRLLNLNYFSRVELYPSDTLVPGRKDVNVIVEEKRTGSFNFGAGFSSIDNLLGFAEITQSNFDITNWPNFTGGGQRFRTRLQYGVSRKDFIFSLTEPYFLDYKLSVTGEAFYREASFVSDVYSERRFGFDLSMRKPLTDFTALRLGYRLENIGIIDVDDSASDTIKEEAGNRLKSMISAGISYDARDSVFLTRSGQRLDVNTYAAGGFLGGDTDIFGWSIEGSKYFLLPGDTILTLNAEVGAVSTWFGGDRVPIFDRLYVGGANNLRGFRFRDVGPKDDEGEPIGGKTLARATIEYTFPVMEKIRGALFYDVGFVNEKSYDFTPGKEENGSAGLNQDVGIGVRLDLPIGPVRIDYGIPITSDAFNDSGGKFNFNIGYQF